MEHMSVLIVGTPSMRLEGICALIESDRRLKLLDCENWENADKAVHSLAPAIIVASVTETSRENLNSLITDWRQQNSRRVILFILETISRNVVLDLIDSGANGYISWLQSSDSVLNCIVAAADGAIVLGTGLIDDTYSETVDQLYDNVALTPKEREVTTLVANGLSNKLIAQHMGIGLRAVEAHLTSVYQKTGFGSRTQLAAWVILRRRTF